MKKISIFMMLFVLMISTISLPVKADTTQFEPVIMEEQGIQETKDEGGLSDYTELYGQKKLVQKGFKPSKARSANVTKELAYIAVMIEFPDANLKDIHLDDTKTLANAEALMNTGNGTITTAYENVAITSLKDYIETYSYHKFTTKAQFYPQDANKNTVSHISSKPRTYYLKKSATNPNGYTTFEDQMNREYELIKETIKAIEPQLERDYTEQQLDQNNDKYIDAISFFVEGMSPISETAEIEWQDLLWSHKTAGYFSTDINGTYVYSYNLINAYDSKSAGGLFSLNRSGNGTIIHEFMHTLGLPDLYRGSYQYSDPVGIFDMMAYSSGLEPKGILSYQSADYLEWHTPLDEITKTAQYTLKKPTYTNSNEKSSVKIISPMNGNEYIVAEYFTRSKNLNAAANPENDGVVLYRINDNVSDGNINGIPGGNKDAIYVYRPMETLKNSGYGEIKKAVLSQSVGRTTYGKSTSGNEWDKDTLYYSDGSNSKITVSIVSESTDEITIKVTIPEMAGSGTQSDPFLISSTTDFATIMGQPNAYYSLARDLNLNGVKFNGFENFAGHFNGNNYTITNATINGSSFFGDVEVGAEIKDLKFTNLNVTDTTSNYTGGVASSNFGTIRNVIITSGNISGSVVTNGIHAVGGMVGTLGDTGVIENSYSSANVSKGTNTGGLIGLNQNGTIVDCYANGKVTKGYKYTGALIGAHYFLKNAKFNQPVNTYYDIRKTEQRMSVGGIVYGTLSDGKTGREGMEGLSMSDATLNIVTKPRISMSEIFNDGNFTTAKLRLGRPDVLQFDSNTGDLVATSLGTSKVEIGLTIGTNKIWLFSNVTVTAPTDEIALSRTSLKLPVKTTSYLKANVVSSSNANQLIKWKSSNPKVASVDQNGKVTAIMNGTTRISATMESGVQANCIVTVYTTVAKVSLNRTSIKTYKGATYRLYGSVLPTSASTKTVTWKSSNTNVATVSSSGLVTAKNLGSATITGYGADGKYAKCTITVENRIYYVLNGGTNGSNPSTYYYQNVYLKNPSKKYYQFLGWYSDSKYKYKVTSIGKYGKTNRTLYARWKKIQVGKGSYPSLRNTKGRKLVVSYKKSYGARGYEIAYSRSSKFTSSTTKRIKTISLSRTLTGLSKGRYYVRIRPYAIDSTSSYVYGTYGTTRSILITK